MAKRPNIFLLAVALLPAWGLTWADDGAYRALGYMYLSPLPGSEYTSTQTRYVLMRFTSIDPATITNLSQCIHVTGAASGNHAGTTKIATDNRTVIFTMSTNFQANELVTVNLNPLLAAGSIAPYQYQFMISTHMPDPPTITARGDNPPDQTKENAFDGNASTSWADLVVPNGSTNFSWIQYTYPNLGTHVVNQYALTSASDAPERDPMDWHLYGVDAALNLTLLDTRTNQLFSSRGQTGTFSFTNTTDYRGYRLEITKVANPGTATAVQLGELAFIDATGSILREYWTNITGTAVSDLTSNPNYPDNPSGSDQLSSFEAPTDWAEYYGTRVRGYVTAPSTGSYTFWIASDDNGELWLSTNDSPTNKVKIAYVASWTSSRQWNKESNQKSVPISLVAGQKYYVEALQKEHGGGDNLAVGWAKPGQSTSAPSEVIPGWALSPWTGGSETPPASAPAATSVNVIQVPSVRSATSDQASPGVSGIMPNGVSVPSDFPWINITTNDNPDPHPIFIDNRGGNGKPYNVIFDNNGSPIWYKRMPAERRDMKVQPNGMLTMWASDHFDGYNNHYELTTTYWPVNGYGLDDHELQVLADGTYFLIARRSETMDMSRYVVGGNPSASVTEQVLQQFTAAGELIFQWRAWDHLDILGQQEFINLLGSSFDFPHMNTIDIDSDGHILVSGRNNSEVTKINRDTGEVIWRMGGLHNQFTFVNDPLNGPRNQHCVRMVSTNRYTIFDNGNLHSPSMSRAVEYVLNPSNMTATLVWQYPDPPTASIYSYYMGNCQRLSNGNTLINWAIGSLPKLTEVRPDGTKAFEMNWVNNYEAYRVWRCAWQGYALQPYLIVESYPDNITLIYNQFGDTNVASYRIYGGTTSQSTNLLATSGVTLKQLTNLQNGSNYYFRVTAVNKQGVEGPFSNEEMATVNIVKPGQNMTQNGDFSGGTNSWALSTSGSGSATWSIVGGVAFIDVINRGTLLTSVRLRQTGFKLVQGKQYVLEFDAWASAGRAIEARLQNQTSGATYALASPTLTTTLQHFKYPFVMTSATDLNTRLSFNVGASAGDVYLDNVAVWMVPTGDLNRDARVDLLDLKLLTGDWLKQQGSLSTDLNGDGKVDFNDLGILGENWSSGP